MRRTAHLGVAMRPDYDDPGICESARNELEQFERALIGLVQIVKDYQQRCGTRDLLEQGRDRIKQPKNAPAADRTEPEARLFLATVRESAALSQPVRPNAAPSRGARGG
jgi:hypothetical protein